MYCSTKGYYLSLFSSNLQVQFFYFKTSHVIVYQRCNHAPRNGTRISKHLMLLFILWWSARLRKDRRISKHLMLLFIRTASLLEIVNCYFKTSHVIIYLMAGNWIPTARNISKHFMLLFIGATVAGSNQ